MLSMQVALYTEFSMNTPDLMDDKENVNANETATRKRKRKVTTGKDEQRRSHHFGRPIVD